MYRFQCEDPRQIPSLDIFWSFSCAFMLTVGMFGSECEMPEIVDENAPIESRACMCGMGFLAMVFYFWRYEFAARVRFDDTTLGVFAFLFIFLFECAYLFHFCFWYFLNTESLPALKVFFYEALIVTGMLHVPIMQLSEEKDLQSRF